MKLSSFLNKTFIIFGLLVATNQIFAATNNSNNANNPNKNMQNQMWTCQTNASSSSNPADQQADDEMSKKAKSAKDAYAFALKNCRDCTKITCEIYNQ